MSAFSTAKSSLTATEHFRLAPHSLLLPLQHNNVSEMHLSLVTGRWKAEQWGQPQHSEIGGTGAELRAWFRDEKYATRGYQVLAST